MAIPSTMADLSTTANSNSPAGSENPGQGDDFLRAIQAIVRTTNAKGADIASSTTTDIGAATGEFVDVTGTTTITGLGTIVAGIQRTVRFTGALTLTHNGTSLILPSSANITTANGDCAIFRSLGSGNWKCIVYQPVSGSSVSATFIDSSFKISGSSDATKLLRFEVDGFTTSTTRLITPANRDVSMGLLTHGQCRLTKSGANLLLSPFNGNKLIINGQFEDVPNAGVTLAPPATTLTLYYIYAYMNSGTMTLEASTTTHATDTTTGVEIKSGDATRTYLGLARTVTNAWVDTAQQRFVCSWFNPQDINGFGRFTTNRTSTATSFTEVNSEIRVEFLTHAISSVQANAQGVYSVSSAVSIAAAIAYDGTTDYVPSSVTSSASGNFYPFNADYKKIHTEGYHYATLLSVTTTPQTNTFYFGATQDCRVQVLFKG